VGSVKKRVSLQVGSDRSMHDLARHHISLLGGALAHKAAHIKQHVLYMTLDADPCLSADHLAGASVLWL
jgi:hypothetical protein